MICRQGESIKYICSDSVFSFFWNVRSQLEFENLNIYVSHQCPCVTRSVNLLPDLLIKSGTIYWNGFRETHF